MYIKGPLLQVELVSGGNVIELAAWQDVVAVEDRWLPCQFPERPIDRNAAIEHIIRGEFCRPCEIAREAHKRLIGGHDVS